MRETKESSGQDGNGVIPVMKSMSAQTALFKSKGRKNAPVGNSLYPTGEFGVNEIHER